MLNAVQNLTDLTEQLTEQLNAVRQVSAKLKKHGAGAGNLVTALQELSKTFDVIQLELKTYLALDFSEPNLPAASKNLVDLEGGEIFKQLGAARARSGKLGSIYERELRPWFAAGQELTDQERINLDSLFRALGEWDPTQIIPAMEEVSNWLTEKAHKTLTHVEKGELDQAESDVRAARLEVLSLRQAMAKTSGELLDLEVQFTPGEEDVTYY
jgi:hypothetical protein